MQAQVRRHQEEPPIGRGHVQSAGKGHVPPDLQERKHLTGEDHTTDHQPQHRRQSEQIDRSLQDADGGIFPFEQPCPPAPVENVVEKEQEKQPRTHPLMGGVAPQVIAHLEQHPQGHCNIHNDFHDLFWLHKIRPSDSNCLPRTAHRRRRPHR